MSVRRALVDCVVLSLQDACVFYPCCKGCFSRIEFEPDRTRCRCSKCGYSCLREQVDHRYRLSLRVNRDTCIFGVTVFGTCLDPFFGIHASGLQRLVETLDGPVGASTRSTLLRKAVEDCFIGRHFIFGLKVTETEKGPWLGGPSVNGSSSKDRVQLIASQMILPKAAGLGGCTVLSYYRVLLQKAAEYELKSADSSKTRPPATTMLLIPCHSPGSSFNNTTLSTSALLSLSLQRSPYQDNTLTPTPPWQQSLGLVTSSAEQEESCSTQDNGDENSRQTDINKTPHHAQRGCLENHEVTEETVHSPSFSLECSSYNFTSFAEYAHSSIEKAAGNTPMLNTFRPFPLGHNSSKAKGFSARELTNTFLSSSLTWEDLPFSESLTEFLCVENKDFDIGGETDSHLNVQNQKEKTRNNLEIRSRDKNASIESISVCHSNTQMPDSHSQILLDITNTSAPNGSDRHDLTDQVCKSPVGCVNKSQNGNICSHECSQEDEKASSLSFENEEEQLEGDTYNCSADLFSSSLTIDMNTNTLNTHADTVRMPTEACPQLSKPVKQYLRSEKANVSHSTPGKQKQKSNKCMNRDSLIPPIRQDLDFMPPSQSTPIVKVAVASGPSASSCTTLAELGEFSSQPDSQCSSSDKVTSSLCELNSANQLSQCGRELTKENLLWRSTSSRHSHRLTPKRRFWKPDNKNHLQTRQHQSIQREALNTRSTRRIDPKCDSSNCDVTVCDYEEDEVIIVPPTPAAETQRSVKLRRRMQTHNSCNNLGFTLEGQQRNGVNCKRTLLDQTVGSSQRGLALTGSCDSGTVDEGSLNGSNCYLLGEEDEACDWSRDLFSDSV